MGGVDFYLHGTAPNRPWICLGYAITDSTSSEAAVATSVRAKGGTIAVLRKAVLNDTVSSQLYSVGSYTSP